MADAPELEFLQRTLVDPGLLAPDHLNAWRLGWPGGGSFFAYLVELGVLARPDLGTLNAVYKGYLKVSAAGLLKLFKLPAPRPGPHVPGDRSPERPEAHVPGDRSVERSGPHVPGDRSAERSGPHVPADRSAERSGPHVPGDRSAERSGPHVPADRSAERERARQEAAREAEATGAARSSPAQRAAVAAAIDAALSALPMEPSAGMPALQSARSGPGQVGDFVAGYQLRARLGQGARGAVYRAWAAAQGRSVVIKLMPMSSQGGGLASAAAQAAIHGRVRHPGVLKVLAAGEEGELSYLVFEDLHAVSLAEHLAGQRTLTAARVARIGAEVARTLAAAAAVGVVHGDLKPAHLLVFGPEPRVKVSDFLAPGEAPSSRAYLAPERLRGGLAPDLRADMYSLGATLHHAATGVVAAAGRARPLIDLGFPAPLSQVVARLMHAQPGARFASWDEVGSALLDAEPAAPEDMSHRAGEDQA
jgi:hypothetical protein